MTRRIARTSLIRGGLAVVAAVTLAACAGRAVRLPFFGIGGTAISFVTASGGLPESGMWKSDIAFADVNGDGFVDLAATVRLGKGARVWLGNGAGTWTDSSAGLEMARSCGGSVAFGDANNDGRSDLFVADHCSGAYVYLQEADGRWTKVAERLGPGRDGAPADGEESDSDDGLRYPNGTEALAVGDIDHDRCLDIVLASSEDSGIRVLRGDCSGRTWREVSTDLPRDGFANRVRLTDLNGDGHLDIFASYFEGPRVWLGDGQNQWRLASQGLPTPVFGGIYWAITVGDVNGDGRPDIAASNWVDGPEVYLQNADGSWQSVTEGLPHMSAVGVALGDLDQDGHTDLVASGTSEDTGNVYGLFIAKGDGTGRWTAMKNNLPTTGLPIVWGVGLADVDNDGQIDIAAASGGVPPMVERVPAALANRVVVWRTQREL